MSGILNLLMGIGSRNAQLQAATYTNTNVTPTNSSAYIRLDSDGGAYSNAATGANGGVDTLRYTWMLGVGPSSAYEARATLTAGTLSSGTVDTWLGLGTDRNWQRDRTSDTAGTDSATITLEIRDAVTLVVYASKSVTLQAVVDV